jgi:small-conductance mechanosensitive channel
VADTRLRFLRRLVVAGIVVFGLFLGLRAFTSLSGVMASILASGALLVAVLGFAAQRTLANFVAGVMLAVTQPLRIGDVVTVEGETGTVEDVRLNYSILRSAEGRRIFIPNEKLAAGVLKNDTIVDPDVKPQASFWLPAHADVERAIGLLEEIADEESVSVAEITEEGVRVSVLLHAHPATERAGREAALRREGLRVLRAAGVLAQD